MNFSYLVAILISQIVLTRFIIEKNALPLPLPIELCMLTLTTDYRWYASKAYSLWTFTQQCNITAELLPKSCSAPALFLLGSAQLCSCPIPPLLLPVFSVRREPPFMVSGKSLQQMTMFRGSMAILFASSDKWPFTKTDWTCSKKNTTWRLPFFTRFYENMRLYWQSSAGVRKQALPKWGQL